MPYCASCGAPLELGATFCGRCGSRVGAPAIHAYAPAFPSGPRRAVGAVTEPWIVVILAIVTLNIYQIFFWWRVTKETDAFAGTPGHAHGRLRTGTFLTLGGAALVLGGFVILLTSLAAGGAFDPSVPRSDDPFQNASPGALALFVVCFLAGMILALTGVVMMFTAYWRSWSVIERDERSRASPSPLSPGLMLVFFLIPYVNIVTTYIALHRTQRGLNEMWAAESARPA